jgi:hypothetical protein
MVLPQADFDEQQPPLEEVLLAEEESELDDVLIKNLLIRKKANLIVGTAPCEDRI